MTFFPDNFEENSINLTSYNTSTLYTSAIIIYKYNNRTIQNILIQLYNIIYIINIAMTYYGRVRTYI